MRKVAFDLDDIKAALTSAGEGIGDAATGAKNYILEAVGLRKKGPGVMQSAWDQVGDVYHDVTGKDLPGTKGFLEQVIGKAEKSADDLSAAMDELVRGARIGGKLPPNLSDLKGSAADILRQATKYRKESVDAMRRIWKKLDSPNLDRTTRNNLLFIMNRAPANALAKAYDMGLPLPTRDVRIGKGPLYSIPHKEWEQYAE